MRRAVYATATRLWRSHIDNARVNMLTPQQRVPVTVLILRDILLQCFGPSFGRGSAFSNVEGCAKCQQFNSNQNLARTRAKLTGQEWLWGSPPGLR